jgi:dTDP-4-amino-4,6-dideoxygalactose transaminase
MYAYASGACPNAAKASSEIISLPLHLNLTRNDVNMVSDLLIRYTQ